MAAVENDQERPPITQLEFRQAMHDFKTMFPEMDEDVIEVVLRSNNGAVDSTIDQLLTMSTDNENERLRTELDATENDELPPCYSPSTPPPSYNQAVPYPQSPSRVSAENNNPQVAATSISDHSQTTNEPTPKVPTVRFTLPEENEEESLGTTNNSMCHAALCTTKQWQPPLLGKLPTTFLRLNELPVSKSSSKAKNVTVLSSTILQQRIQENERERQSNTNSEDSELVQYLEDERVALFLQNEEFVQELKDNKEFLSTLERASSDVSPQDCELTPKPVPQVEEHFPYCFDAVPPTEESDAAFREKIKNMGKVSRRKFTQLAKLFSRRKRRSFKPILGDGSNPSRDNLLLHEDEYSELSEDDSDTEINKKDTWNSHIGGPSGRSPAAERPKMDA